MATFTKGPWQSMAKDGKYAVETVENYGGADSDRSVLVADCDTSDAIHAREKEANCRLIAAAPDLLAALKAAENWHGELDICDVPDDGLRGLLQQMRDAIQKATEGI